MEHHTPKDDQAQVEHSLPGTNMAGKGPDYECDTNLEQNDPRGEGHNINKSDGRAAEQE